MTAEETRNLAVIDRWVETYNNDVERMVDECYAPDCVVEDMAGGRVFRGRDELRALERAILRAAPGRRMSVTNVIASGDSVVAEVVGTEMPRRGDGPDSFRGCIVLRFRDGLIESDRTYVVAARVGS